MPGGRGVCMLKARGAAPLSRVVSHSHSHSMITPRRTLSRVGLVLVILSVLFLFPGYSLIRTTRDMRRANQFLQARHTENDLRAAYRVPANAYADYAAVPEYYRRGFSAYTNCEFHVYQREGLPYWFFVAAVNRQSRIIECGVVRKLGK